MRKASIKLGENKII